MPSLINHSPVPAQRLVSLDVFRGITMFLLIGEAAGFHASFTGLFQEGSWIFSLAEQLHHHPWNGLRFWDLIQPFFMFIVGVAMPFSLRKRLTTGTYGQAFRHILVRCFILFLLGTGLHCVYNQRLVWELWNVLTQLSFTILITFLLMRLPFRFQLIASLLLLLLTEILYRVYAPEAPFIKDENFGSWMDMVLMGKINPGGGWVTINCLPTAAHTIWGALCGQLILSGQTARFKLRALAISGIALLILGYGLDIFSITPIVKRIATTSFVFSSGGWCLLTLAWCYWWVDIKGHKKWTTFFTIVGMNPIFIYLISETVGKQWVWGFVQIFNDGILGFAGLPANFLLFTNALITWFIFWYLCYFLYQKKIFFKI